MKLVIGLGNQYRGDDAAGLAVADRLWNVEVLRSATGSFELMDRWDGYDEVVIVDAAVSGAPPGTVHRYDPHAGALPTGTFASTHAVGLAETIELARELGRLPPRLTVYGIEAGTVSQGEDMSPPVAEAVASLAKELDRA